MSKDKLWCYAFPNAMVNHKFTDDVAICYADNKDSAIKKFGSLYLNIDEKDVSEVKFNYRGISILTDY